MRLFLCQLPRAWALNVVVLLASGICIQATQADVLYFTENFNYAYGDLGNTNNTNNGGTGWQSGSYWSGGGGSTGNQVTNPLPGTFANSVQLASQGGTTSRALGTIYSTDTLSAGNAYYLSFLFNANPFQGGSGQYAGVSLSGTNTNLFVGMPGDSGKIGVDWTNVGQPVTSDQPGDNSNYLILVKIQKGSDSTYGKVTFWVTTDLSINGSTLEGQANAGSTDNEGLAIHSGLTFDTVSFSGGYTPGSINLAGLAMGDTANAAVNFTLTAVPEPGTLLMGSLALAIVACGLWRNRSTKPSLLPVTTA